MPQTRKRTWREATHWLFATAINEHIMKCQAALFPDANPECAEKCCPNCCDTCSTLRWFRDEADGELTKNLNRYGDGLYDWQMADGSVDWSVIEPHWDDSGISCGREPCLQADARRLGMAQWTEEALAGWTKS